MSSDPRDPFELELWELMSRHADRLDGRAFQAICLHLAEGMWPSDQLDTLLNADHILQAMRDSLPLSLETGS